VPQFVPTTLLSAGGREVDAHLLITDTGTAARRYIVGVSVTAFREQEGRLNPTLDESLVGQQSATTGETLSTFSEPETLDTAAIFEDRPLHEVAALGRKEHWWIDGADMEAPSPVRILGEGGFGVVVAARLHGQPVAAKTLRDPHRFKSFCAEIRTLRRARHPCIASFLGAAFDEKLGTVTLVYELISGARLDRFARSDSCGPLARFQVAFQLCSALCYLHSLQPAVVHGDLKAGNVIIEDGPRAKLIDFGLARVLSANPGNLGFSVAWAAPELALGDLRPTTAVDVFGFGWLLFVVMTGEVPYSGASGTRLATLMHQTLKARKLPPIPIPAKAPWRQETADLCSMCLQFNPKERPAIDGVMNSLRHWGSLADVASQVGVSSATPMLKAMSWTTLLTELHSRSQVHEQEVEVQVDAIISNGSATISVVVGAHGPLGPDSIGGDLCRLARDPNGLRIALCSTLKDIQRGALLVPFMQEFVGVVLNGTAECGKPWPVRLRALFPDTSGCVSVKFGFLPQRPLANSVTL